MNSPDPTTLNATAHASRHAPQAYGEGDLRRAAEASIRAPSLLNSQPWLFRLRHGAIEILADPARRLAVADRAGWAVRIACGAAGYNARLALAITGTPADVTLHGSSTQPAARPPGSTCSSA